MFKKFSCVLYKETYLQQPCATPEMHWPFIYHVRLNSSLCSEDRVIPHLLCTSLGLLNFIFYMLPLLKCNNLFILQSFSPFPSEQMKIEPLKLVPQAWARFILATRTCSFSRTKPHPPGALGGNSMFLLLTTAGGHGDILFGISSTQH